MPALIRDHCSARVSLELLVGDLLEMLGWSGIFLVQFIRSADHHYLIDLNPRTYGSLALAAGMNLPVIWADLS